MSEAEAAYAPTDWSHADLSFPTGPPPREGPAAPARIRLIGRMEAWTSGGVSILPIGRKTRAMLAIVALEAPRPVLRSHLAGLLWSRRPDEQARASLRQEIHRLLEALQPAGHEIVRVARDHLSLRSEGAWVDVHEVLHATAADSSALALLDSELLEDLNGIDPAFDQWLATERGSLRDQARTVVETLLGSQAEPGEVIPVATRLLAIDGANEEAWRALMRAHAGRGERGLALQTFERCKAALDGKLGMSASPDTVRLAADIRTGALGPNRPGAGNPAGPPDASRIDALGTAALGTGALGTGAPRTCAPRVGVLPLRLIGAEGAEAGLALGLVEAVTAALARVRWWAVVSSSSLAKAGSRDEAVLAQAFGLDFLLDGSVQRAAQRARVTLRLLDLCDGNRIVWARRFDRDTADFLHLQDDIAAEVAAQIEPELLLLEGRRAAGRPAGDATAYDLVARALPMVARLQRDEFIEGGALLARALALRPDYAAAHSWRAYWGLLCVAQGWADGPSVAVEASCDAECAITLDPQDARGLTIAGHVRAFLHRRRREALELHGRALSLNPNLGMAWGFSAMTFSYLGEWDEAARRFGRLARLSSLGPGAFVFDAAMARLELGRRDYQAAVLWGRRATEAAPNYVPGLKNHLAALGHAGLMIEAYAVRARLLALEPGYTIRLATSRSPYEHAADMEQYAAGLRLAGLPEAGGADVTGG